MKTKQLIHKYRHRHLHDSVHALVHHADTIEHTLIVMAMAICFASNALLAGTSAPALQTTEELIYPVKGVTSLPCRQQMKLWSELDASCKVPLGTIANADYDRFRDNNMVKDTPYMSIYTTLRGASYNGQRDMDKGDHAGVDIASAKGTPLYAVAHGVVTFAGEQAGYGNVVKVMFRYKGVTYHAVYGHMDTITVAKGDILTQGQLIGTIGNSGSTFGALGGNHVHFEINKDSKGSPMFYYAGCPALVEDKKSFTEITNNGLCRSYREAAQMDPIKFIEQSKGGKIIASLTPVQTVSNNHDVAPEISSSTPTVSENSTPSFIELKKIDAAKLTQDAILFVRERDIQLVVTYTKTMTSSDKGVLQLFVTKKGSAAPFDGPLPTAFTLVSPTNGITSEIKSIYYLNDGVQSINFSVIKKGKQKLAITLGGQTIGVVEVKGI